MKNYRITYRNEDGVRKELVLNAESMETLGQAIIDYVDETYGVDSYTDGESVWYTDEDGEQHTVMNHMKAEED
jgi:hypothetical protein